MSSGVIRVLNLLIPGRGRKTGQVSLNDLSGRERYSVFIMPRRKPVCPKGDVFHVLNPAVARLTIFEKSEEFDAFLQVIDETWEIVPLPIYAMVLMPNRVHFVVQPTTDDQVIEFFRRLSVRHMMRYHVHSGTGGTGHLYQGRFLPIQLDFFRRSSRRRTSCTSGLPARASGMGAPAASRARAVAG